MCVHHMRNARKYVQFMSIQLIPAWWNPKLHRIGATPLGHPTGTGHEEAQDVTQT